MKAKLMFAAVALLGVLASSIFTFLDEAQVYNRVMQHEQYAEEGITAIQAGEGESQLPIVMIDTDGQEIPVEMTNETITAHLSVIDRADRQNSIGSEPTLTSAITIRCRGNSSRKFDKKSYAVTLINADGTENPQAIMGMDKAKDWALNGPCLDRTLLRNYLCLNLAGMIMSYAPDLRFCEVYINGTFSGLYLMMETITKGTGRVEMDKPSDGQSRTDYLVRWDRKGKGNANIENFTYYTYLSGESGMDVRYPGAHTLTPDRLTYVEQDISKIEKSLYSYDLLSETKGYANYIDRTAFAQYFVINELFRNVDAGRYSTYIYRDLKGKAVPIVWDFNNACDNYIDYLWDEAGFTLQDAPWFDAMMQDKAFVDEIIRQYRILRATVLNETYLNHLIDTISTFLGDEVEKNYAVYGYLFDLSGYDGLNYLTPVERNVTSYAQAVAQLKTFITVRGDWMDRKIEILYQYCHESRNKELLLK